ncbi:hypothetical protein ROTAS13_03295 [Roseomonas sp. TAS13]|nr:hypothetical protein ROTAS13_03295 [Roseomonas sp. TAS13]
MGSMAMTGPLPRLATCTAGGGAEAMLVEPSGMGSMRITGPGGRVATFTPGSTARRWSRSASMVAVSPRRGPAGMRSGMSAAA